MAFLVGVAGGVRCRATPPDASRVGPSLTLDPTYA